MNNLPMHARQTLQSLGFLDGEIRILLVLFRHRKLSTKEISRETALSFDAVQFSLHSLELKKLVRRTSTDENDVVEICREEEFAAWIDEQKERNSQMYEEAAVIMQSYLANLQEAAWKPAADYYEGREGIIEIYEDMIAKEQDVYGWTDIERIHQTLGAYMDHFIAERIRKNITSYAIMPKNRVNEEYAAKSQMRHVKFSKHLPIDGEIRIYGDNVAVITFHEDKPVGFVFRGAVMASVFRAIFEHAWESVPE